MAKFKMFTKAEEADAVVKLYDAGLLWWVGVEDGGGVGGIQTCVYGARSDHDYVRDSFLRNLHQGYLLYGILVED